MVTQEVVQASFRLLDYVPKVGELVNRFRERVLQARESLALANHALALRYESPAEAPVEAETLLKARRPEDEGTDLWRTMNRVKISRRAACPTSTATGVGSCAQCEHYGVSTPRSA